jgi:competence protein ComEC
MEKSEKKSFSRPLIKIAGAALLVLAVWLMLSDKPLEGLENTFGGHENEIVFEDGLTVTFIDVGQGDSALVVCDDSTMLIDGGEPGREDDVMRVLRSAGIRKLDCIVATHPHSDHIGTLSAVIDGFRPAKLYMPYIPDEYVPELRCYDTMMYEAQDEGTEIVNLSAGDEFMLGSARFTVLGPCSADSEDLNNMSLVMRLDYGESSFLFTGDAGYGEETGILSSGADIDCDVLKAGHHGSSDSSCESFLSAVTPDYCVISVGADNDYGHPGEKFISRILEYTDKIYRTDYCGNIIMASDGKKITVSFES